MKWSVELERTEILYREGWEFDAFGPGIIKGIETRNGSPTSMVEILFPDSRSILRQFLSLDVFMERVKRGRIAPTTDENRTLHRYRVRERELINKPIEVALEEILSFSDFECAIFIELLKERIEGEARLSRKEAAVLLGRVGALLLLKDGEEAKDIFGFLLGQTKKTSRRKAEHPYMLCGLTVHAQFQREQNEVMLRCFLSAAAIALDSDHEQMILALKKAANRLKLCPSTLLKRTAGNVLKNLKEVRR